MDHRWRSQWWPTARHLSPGRWVSLGRTRRLFMVVFQKPNVPIADGKARQQILMWEAAWTTTGTISRLHLRLYPTRAPVASTRLSVTTGALFPIKSDNKPWTVPPDQKEQNVNTWKESWIYRTCFVPLDGQQWRKFRYTVQYFVHFEGSQQVLFADILDKQSCVSQLC